MKSLNIWFPGYGDAEGLTPNSQDSPDGQLLERWVGHYLPRAEMEWWDSGPIIHNLSDDDIDEIRDVFPGVESEVMVDGEYL